MHAVLTAAAGATLWYYGVEMVDMMSKGGKQKIDNEWTGVSAAALKEAYEKGDSATRRKIDQERKRRGRKKGKNKSWD